MKVLVLLSLFAMLFVSSSCNSNQLMISGSSLSDDLYIDIGVL